MKDMLFKAHMEGKKVFAKLIKNRKPEKLSKRILRSVYQKTIKKTKLTDTAFIKRLKARVTRKKK